MPTELLNVRSIFDRVVNLSSAAERNAYLEEACAGNPEIRWQVEALLKANADAGSFLQSPPVGISATIDQPPSELPGTLIGRYKLLEQVGEGGMGVVYVAEQTEPVRRRVALKIIKPGMDTRQVIARFEAERQALAMMEHPNIARVLDAGTTEAGRPYFVMELVRGMPITEYCDQERLSPRQRLELFVDVCQAVQHAHQKGIIHRDLKPSNVMITLHDGVPVVKVIDFGVAKAVGQQLTERTVYTGLTQLVGTPLYMSPEQAELSGLDIDTRSDVYSLGVLLYELLTGTTPFDKERLKSVGFDEMRRMIREEEAETVSARIARTRRVGQARTASAGPPNEERANARRWAGAALAPPYELDWIVMKALEKDRSRRYESASALATDIQRYLSDEPVLACPPTTMYRFHKFARKHKPALATAAVVAASLLLGTTVSAWQAVRATTAEAQANANANQAQEKAQEANQQRDEAQKQRDEVRALADKLQAAQTEQRSTLYAAHMILAQRAWDVGGVERVKELLAHHRPQPGQTDLRGFEWHYLNRLCHTELLTLQHPGEVNSLAYSPDGKRLAVTSKDGTLKVWDTHSGKELLTIKEQNAWGVAFSRDGLRLFSGALSGRQGESKIRDAETGKVLLTFKSGHNSITFSPDGKRLAAIGDDVEVLNANTGEVQLTLQGSGQSVVFSPDGKRLAAIGDEAKVWDAQTGEELLKLKAHCWYPQSLAYSPDGQRLAAAGDEVKVWDAQTGKELHSLEYGGANSVSFHPDGKHLAAGSWRGMIRVWDLSTGLVVRTVKGSGSIAAYSPDGQRLASNAKNVVRIWDANKDQDASLQPKVRGQLSLDGKLRASESADHIIKIQDTVSGQETVVLKGHTVRVWNMAFAPDNKRLLSGGGGNRTSVSRDNRSELKLWDISSGQELFNLPVANGTVADVAYSPDGKRLASISGPTTIPAELKLWDAATGQELFSLKGHAGSNSGSSVAFSPDSKLLASSTKDDVMLWDVQTGQERFALGGPGGWPLALEFSADGKRLAAGGIEGVVVWDTGSGRELVSLKGHANNVRSAAFSPDGARLATSSNDQTVKVWDSTTGQELLTFQAQWPNKVAFSADGHRLTVNEGEMAKVYDATPLPERP